MYPCVLHPTIPDDRVWDVNVMTSFIDSHGSNQTKVTITPRNDSVQCVGLRDHDYIHLAVDD